MNPIWKKHGLTTVVLVLLTALPLLGQTGFDPERDVGLSASVKPSAIPAAGSGELVIELKLPQGVHITNLDFGFFFVRPDLTEGVTWGEAVFPPGVDYQGEKVYRGLIPISVPLALSVDLSPGTGLDLSGVVGYQICTETDPIFCTPPVERTFQASLNVAAGGVVASEAGTDVSGEELSIE
ncbi:MAG TPA: hypothetical protein ENL08_04790, partial [Bacteroidetes bacterium]|nr:hypothetical protein [Bacteroidota bacterium]